MKCPDCEYEAASETMIDAHRAVRHGETKPLLNPTPKSSKSTGGSKSYYGRKKRLMAKDKDRNVAYRSIPTTWCPFQVRLHHKPCASAEVQKAAKETFIRRVKELKVEVTDYETGETFEFKPTVQRGLGRFITPLTDPWEEARNNFQRGA